MNNRSGPNPTDSFDAENPSLTLIEKLRQGIIGSEFNKKGGDFLGVQRNKRLKNMLDNI